MARFEVLPLPDESPADPAVVGCAAGLLEAGGILAHPTGTVYGIGGAGRLEVDAAIARLKERAVTADVPLLRLVDSVATLRRVLPDLWWDDRAACLAARFWPGPLTLVLADRGDDGVAVRVEGHAGLREVLASWGSPMTSTSLNRTGEPAAATAGRARRVLASMPAVERPVLLLDSGDLPGPPPSTLVSLLDRETKILRVGAIAELRIRECLEASELQ